jgi:bifunctional NMN adenylyltransferase/nudix hydrolase
MGKTGVIIGRFQVDNLHDGHTVLIDHVNKNSDDLVIFVGLSPLKCTYNNPLDFSAVKKMLEKAYPDAIIMYIKDEISDKSWSEKLDKMLKESIHPNDEVCLYGSRDSFIKHYHGEYKTKELEQTVFTSGTSVRREIANSVVSNADFRKGIIWAAMNQYTGPATTVDVAILNDKEDRVLLGKKPNEDKLRFVGGFAESGESFEDAVLREAFEETDLVIMDICYIKSFPVDDWRYKNEKKKITTLFFKANILEGRPTIKDNTDICELVWVDIDDSLPHKVMDVHVPLATTLEMLNVTLHYLSKQK